MEVLAPRSDILYRKDSVAMSSMRHHLLRMHPFLKHKMFSKSMRGFISNPRSHIFKRRWKRGDLKKKPAKIARSPTDLETSQLLEQVLRDVHEIKSSQFGEKNEYVCTINGSWFGEVCGRMMSFTNTGEYGNIVVSLHKPLQKRRKGFMGLEPWNVTARLPFKSRPNYLTVIAINKRRRKVATFLGECLVCRNRPLITGHWLVSHHSRDCESMGATNDVFGDVWRKDNLKELKNSHHTSLRDKVLGKPQQVAIPSCVSKPK